MYCFSFCRKLWTQNGRKLRKQMIRLKKRSGNSAHSKLAWHSRRPRVWVQQLCLSECELEMFLPPKGWETRLIETDTQTVALLFFGRPHSSYGKWFGLRQRRLLFDLCCCTLRTFATEAAGKLASIVRVNLDVVLSPRNGYVCEAFVNQQFALVRVHVD